MSGNHNSGRKPKWLTIEKFEEFEERFSKFLGNDFHHLKGEVKLIKLIAIGISITVVAKMLIDFLWG